MKSSAVAYKAAELCSLFPMIMSAVSPLSIWCPFT